jgi:hypothetical protein
MYNNQTLIASFFLNKLIKIPRSHPKLVQGEVGQFLLPFYQLFDVIVRSISWPNPRGVA